MIMPFEWPLLCSDKTFEIVCSITGQQVQWFSNYWIWNSYVAQVSWWNLDEWISYCRCSRKKGEAGRSEWIHSTHPITWRLFFEELLNQWQCQIVEWLKYFQLPPPQKKNQTPLHFFLSFFLNSFSMDKVLVFSSSKLSQLIWP